MMKHGLLGGMAMIMLCGFAQPEAAPDTEIVETPARAVADVRTLFSTDDYPSAALRNSEEGTVRAQITVGLDGKVESCRIREPSGSEILDDKTCQVMMERASFTPARDADGNAVRDIINLPPIRWQIPEQASVSSQGGRVTILPEGRMGDIVASPTKPDIPIVRMEEGGADSRGPKAQLDGLISWDDYPPAAKREDAEGQVRITLHVDANGKVTGCDILSSSDYRSLDEQTCSLMSERAAFEPATDADGVPVAGTFSRTIEWKITPQRVSRIETTGFFYRVMIDEEGEISACAFEPFLLLTDGSDAFVPPQSCAQMMDAVIKVRDLPQVAAMGDDKMAVHVNELRKASELAIENELPSERVEEGDELVDLHILALEYDPDARRMRCETIVEGVMGQDCDFIEQLGAAYCRRLTGICEGRWISFNGTMLRAADSFEFTEGMRN